MKQSLIILSEQGRRLPSCKELKAAGFAISSAVDKRSGDGKTDHSSAGRQASCRASHKGQQNMAENLEP